MQTPRTSPHDWTRRTLAASICVAILCTACQETSSGDDDDDGAGDSTGAEPATDDGDTAPATDDGITTEGDGGDTTIGMEDGTTGDGATESTGVEPTGDVWVDAEGTVIGLYRVTTDDDEDAVEGLVDSTDATWRVSDDRTEIGAVDVHGYSYWESTDCTGPRYFGEPNDTFDPFREGFVTLVPHDFDELLFVIEPGTASVEITYASWWNAGFGCAAGDPEDWDAPMTFYAESDVRFVTPPAFVPPLTIEHH